MRPTVYLLDAHALLHRAWHALPPLTNSEGQQVQALYGFLLVLHRLIQTEPMNALLVCWDSKEPTFRHEAFEAYKAQREKQPDELYNQIPLIQEALSSLSIPMAQQIGVEADDLLGSAAVKAVEAGWNVVIVTGDRDALQLINEYVNVLLFKKGVSETKRVDEKVMREEFGLTPAQFIEYKMLRGDSSDNIPGIPGIGEKTATELLQTYHTIDGIFKAVHDPSSALKPGVRAKLAQGEADLPLLRRLVTVETGVPMEWVPKQEAYTLTRPEYQQFLDRMSFQSLKNNTNGTEKKTKRTDAIVLPKPTSPSVIIAFSEERASFAEDVTELSAAREQLEVWKKKEWMALWIQGDPRVPTLDRSEKLVLCDGSRSLAFPLALWSDVTWQAAWQEFWKSSANKTAVFHAKELFTRLAGAPLDLTTATPFDVFLAAYVLEAHEGERTWEEVSQAFLGTGILFSQTAVSVYGLWCLSHAVFAKLGELSLLELYKTFEEPLPRILYEMERRGIRIDRPYLDRLKEEFREACDRAHGAMEKMVGHAFNPASPAQLADVLFTELKLSTEGVKRGKTGWSTAATELEKLRGSHPIIEEIEAYREAAKLLHTYIETLPVQADKEDRVHTDFHQALTATGRLSSSDPNLQNIPIRTELGRKIRRAFIAAPGCVLLSCDYAQIELRLAAALSKDKKLIAAFQKNQDIHKLTAAEVWGISLEDVTKDQRRAAKAINFGVLYGQGAFGLSQAAGIGFGEAKEFIRRYFEAYPELAQYLESTKIFAKTHGYVETWFGRRRTIPGILAKVPAVRAQAERMAINMPIQGTEADLLKKAMVDLDAWVKKEAPHVHLLLQVHDELVFEVPHARAEGAAKVICEKMTHLYDFGVPLVVEAKAGQNWEEMSVIS